jgi:hypothetical protein
MSEHRTYGQWSFNGGELSPRMHGRTDQNIYGNALATMLGWLPLIQGPAVTAPGTIYVETAAGPCRLFPFESIVTQGYVIEASGPTAAGPGKLRFYTNDVRVETGPGIAYEVVHPWTLDELKQLSYWQSNDVLYLVGAGKKPKKLVRTSAVTFSLIDLVLTDGPMESGNSDEAVTITADAVTGAATLTCTAAIFAPGDVGSLIELVATDFSNVPSWEPGMTIAAGNQREWAGRVYQCLDNGRTGGNPPEHDEGIAYDGSTGTDINVKGPYGVRWQYLYNAYGLCRITAVTDANHAKADVLKRLADTVATGGTWRWSFGAFSDTRGWPETVGGWNDCLVLTKGNRVFTSVIDDFDNFGRRDTAGDFQRDLSGSFSLPKPAPIQWQASDRLLLLGSATDEYTVERVQIQTGTPGPPVFDIKEQSSYGSAAGKPIQADGRVLFLQRAGRKLREFGYAITNDRYLAPDQTRLASHIGAPGFVEMAWMAEPERIVWAARGDGTLACMTYDPEQQVMGWARRELGGELGAASICRITEPSGKLDQIWIAAEVDGGMTFILRMAPVWQEGDNPETAIFADAALAYQDVPVSNGGRRPSDREDGDGPRRRQAPSRHRHRRRRDLGTRLSGEHGDHRARLPGGDHHAPARNRAG